MGNRIRLIVAGFAAALLLSFVLVACGEGEVDDLNNVIGTIDDSKDLIYGGLEGKNGMVTRCFNDSEYKDKNEEFCDLVTKLDEPQPIDPGPGPGESSNSGSSSSFVCEEDPCEEPSSSSVVTQSSSSSSSISAPVQSTDSSCDEAETIPEAQMSCNWANASNAGGTIISGDSIKLSGKVYSSLDCDERVYLSVKVKENTSINSPLFDAEYDFYSNENKDKKTKTAGDLTVKNSASGKTGTFTWPSPAAGVTASISDPAAIYAEVKCMVTGTSDVLACGKKTCTSTLKVMGAPNPIHTVTTAVKFDNAHTYSSSSIFYIGETPTASGNVTVTNSADSRCGEVKYRVVKASDGSKIEGPVNEAMNIRAEAYCENTDKALTGTPAGITAAAAVVPNPSLDGNCTWSKNPTSSAKGATPSGVTLKDHYGRCGAGAVTYASGAYTTWPSDGIVDAGTYADVKTSVTCTPEAYAVTQKTCPSLTVSQGNAVLLEYDGSKSENQANIVNVPIGDCLDAQYTWTNGGYHPNMNVKCEIDPQFTWAETVNPGRKGYVELTYGTVKNSNTGDYGISAIVRVANTLQVTNGAVEIMNICTDAYIATVSGTGNNQVITKVAEATGKTLKCYMTTNDN